MDTQQQEIKEFVDDLVVMTSGSPKSIKTGGDGSNRHGMSHEKVTQEAKEPDEVAYLKIILDGLVKNRSLIEAGDVDLNSQFLHALKDSVDSILRTDIRVKEEIRVKIFSTFDLLIDNYGKYFKRCP